MAFHFYTLLEGGEDDVTSGHMGTMCLHVSHSPLPVRSRLSGLESSQTGLSTQATSHTRWWVGQYTHPSEK